jgi:hypothetical protein
MCVVRKIESVQGSRLLPTADFHVGSDCNVMISHVLPVAAPTQTQSQPQPQQLSLAAQQQQMFPFAKPGASSLYTAPMPTMPGGVMSLQQPHNAGNLDLSGMQPPPPHALPVAPFGTTLDKLTSTRSCVVMGTADGSLGVCLPVDEKMYRRLALLQQLMLMGTKSKLSFNAKDFRISKSMRKMMMNKNINMKTASTATSAPASTTSNTQTPAPGASKGQSNVLDGTLLWRFTCLDVCLQEELAIVIGTTRDVIIENLNRLDRSCAFF